MNGKPTVISTFAGGGGSSLGYQMAGYKELLAIEWNQNAVDTLKANFKFPVWKRDIKTVKAKEILEFCSIEKGELDVLDGSPPCQGFSTAGKRVIKDDRNDLFKAYVRLIKGLQPKVFVMENVSGMVKGKMKGKFLEIFKALKSTGYKVECKLVNSMFYGVPQARERLVFIGSRIAAPMYPKRNRHVITVEESLQGCEPSETPEFNDSYAKLWDRIRPGQNASYVIGKGYNNCVKLNPKRPAPTLPKLQTGRGFGTIAHWKEPRAISISEAKRLQSFPDDFKLSGSYTEQWARIGNSVPPLLMKAIAKTIKNKCLAHG